MSLVNGISKSVKFVEDDRYHIISKFDFVSSNTISLESVDFNVFEKVWFDDYAPFVF